METLEQMISKQFERWGNDGTYPFIVGMIAGTIYAENMANDSKIDRIRRILVVWESMREQERVNPADADPLPAG